MSNQKIYRENFDDEKPQDWELERGWIVRHGKLIGRGHTWATYSVGKWRNFRFSFRLWIMEKSIVHVNCRLSDKGRYFIGFHGSGLYLSKEAPMGTFNENLARSRVPHGSNRWYNIEIVADGSRIKVAVNGEVELDYIDPEPLLSGTIAFETLKNSLAKVDDLTVIDLAQEPIEPIVKFTEGTTLEFQPRGAPPQSFPRNPTKEAKQWNKMISKKYAEIIDINAGEEKTFEIELEGPAIIFVKVYSYASEPEQLSAQLSQEGNEQPLWIVKSINLRESIGLIRDRIEITKDMLSEGTRFLFKLINRANELVSSEVSIGTVDLWINDTPG
jgi:hypothetical protein